MAKYRQGYNFEREQLLLVVCSTQGDGIPPSDARPFCEWLLESTNIDLRHLKYSVCALGDKSYTHFCNCGRQIDAKLLSFGASLMVPRQDVDKEDWVAIKAWLHNVVTTLRLISAKTVEEMGFELYLDKGG